MAANVVSIMVAAGLGAINEINQALDEDAGLVHARDARVLRQTPLIRAACRQHTDCVRVLLRRGSEVDAWDRLGRTALYCACERGFEETTELLLREGCADMGIVNADGWNALMAAAHAGHASVVRSLLKHQRELRTAERGGEADGGEWGQGEKRLRDVDVTNHHRQSALWLACSAGQEQVVRMLLLEGATWRDRDMGYGLDCREVAETNGHAACVDIIRWFEREAAERPYALHKARLLTQARMVHQRFPSVPPPTYLAHRWPTLEEVRGGAEVEAEACTGSQALPIVGVVRLHAEGDEGPSAAAEEERLGTLSFVTADLGAELYLELLRGLQLRV